jgi:dATP pyrophosphohydrolase
VQVVIFAETPARRRYLLLRRVPDQGGFWQFVTGSLEAGETHIQAALREVREETGLTPAPSDLIDLKLTNTFEIAPRWLHKYEPGVTHNEEKCFALRAERHAVLLDPLEHTDYAWVFYEQALEMLYWESNKAALEAAHSRQC